MIVFIVCHCSLFLLEAIFTIVAPLFKASLALRARNDKLSVVVAKVFSNTLIVLCLINPFTPNGLFYFNFSDRSISNRRSSDSFFIIKIFYRIPVFFANSVDPDQTPQTAASDLGLHCLPMSLLRDARQKWIK